MRLALVVVVVAAACGGTSSNGPDAVPAPTADAGIGSPCSAAAECPGGAANGKCEPFDQCGEGFCSEVCDSSTCPTGSTCVPLTYIDPTTLQTATKSRCFVPCDPTSSTSQCPGDTYCFPGYDVCGSDEVFGQLGSTGGHAAGGGACEPGTPPDPSAGTRLFAANHLVARGNEAAAAIGPDGTFYVGYNPGNVSYSKDGTTWTDSPLDDNTNAGDPSVALDPKTGRLYFSHLSSRSGGGCAPGASFPTGLGVNVSWSDDDGQTWGGTAEVSPAAESMGIQGVDKDWMAVLPQSGVVLISYMTGSNAKTATTSSAMVSRSEDHGATFQEIEVDKSMPGYRNLIQLAAASDDTVWVSYWNVADVNNTLGEVRVAKSTDLGKTWSASVGAIPPNTATFDVPGLAVSPSGSVVAVTWTQPSGPGIEVEDVYAAVSVDGGATFGPPAKVNQDAPCATHWHPFPAVTATGDVYVIWMENRWGFGAVMVARGTVTGDTLSFAPADEGFVSDDANQPFSTTREQFFTGDYVGLALSGQTMLAAFGDLRDASTIGDSEIWATTATVP
jgi:hypothetical protein